jgi:hypothetical protein
MLPDAFLVTGCPKFLLAFFLGGFEKLILTKDVVMGMVMKNFIPLFFLTKIIGL